jgi:hypothetical protein
MTEQPIFESPQEEPKLPTPEMSIAEKLLWKRGQLEGLVVRLGFNETSEMTKLRRTIGTPEGINREALIAWRDQAEKMVENAGQGEDFVCAQVCLLILKTTVYLDANMSDEFFEDLDDITSYVMSSGVDFGTRLKLLDEI